MTRQEFVKRLDGNEFRHTRTCFATGHVEDNETVIQVASITHVYADTDLFSEDFGILVAVVKTGAGHLYCDRFEPV